MSESTHDDDRRDAGPTELAAFQETLARLRPAPDGINIARLLFQAGQRSATRRSWTWPCATAASMMLTATLGFVLLLRPTPQPTERIVTVYVSPPPSTPKVGQVSNQPRPGRLEAFPTTSMATEAEPPTDGSYLQLRREVLTRGLDALPPPAPWPVAVAPAEDADCLLDMPRGSREPWFLRLKRSLKSGDAL